jgi:hypothetical protein
LQAISAPTWIDARSGVPWINFFAGSLCGNSRFAFQTYEMREQRKHLP